MTKKVLIALLIVAPISLGLAMASAETAKLHGLNLQSAIWALASYGGSLIAILLLCDSLRSNVVPVVLVGIVYIVNVTATSMKYGLRNAIIAPVSGIVLIVLWQGLSYVKNSLKATVVQRTGSIGTTASPQGTFKCAECGKLSAESGSGSEELFCPECGGRMETTS